MTSQLNVDTIVDKAGSGGTNVKIGNTSTYVSDGGAVTQSTVQSLAKSWVNIKGTGTISIRDSLNISGITDDGTGQTVVAISNDHANSDYNVTSGANQGGFLTPNGNRAAGQYIINVYNHSGSLTDGEYTGGNTHGDLA